MSLRMYFGIGDPPTNQPDNKDKEKSRTEEHPKPKRPPSGEKQDLGFYFSNSNKVMGSNSNNRRNKRRGDSRSKSKDEYDEGNGGGGVREVAVASVAEEEEEEEEHDETLTMVEEQEETVPVVTRKKKMSPFQKRFQPRHGSAVPSTSTKHAKMHRRQTTFDNNSTPGTGATAASLQQSSAQRHSFNIFNRSTIPNNNTLVPPPVEKASPWQFITGNTPNAHVSPFAGGPAYWPRDAVSDALRARVNGKFINPSSPTVKAKASKGDSVYNDPSVLISMMKGEALPVTSTAALQASIEDKRPMWPPTVAPKQYQNNLPSEERLPPKPPAEMERVDTFAPPDVGTNTRMSASFSSPRPESSRSQTGVGSPNEEQSLLKRMLVAGAGSRSSSRNPMLRTPRTSISGSESHIRRTGTSESVDTIDSTISNGMDYFGSTLLGGMEYFNGGVKGGESSKSANNAFRRKFHRWGAANKAASAKEAAELAALYQLDLEHLSVRDMKYLIEKHGLSYSDCSGKMEFTERTRQALHIAAAISGGGGRKQRAATNQSSLRRGRPSGVGLNRNRPTSSSVNRSSMSMGGGGGRGRHMHSVSVSSVESSNRRSRSTSHASRLGNTSSTYKNTRSPVVGKARGGGYHKRLLGSVLRVGRGREKPVEEIDVKRYTLKSSDSTSASISEHSADEQQRNRAQSAKSTKSAKSKKKKLKKNNSKGSPKVKSRKSGRQASKLTLNRSSRSYLQTKRKQSTMGEYYKHKPRFIAPLAAQFVLVPPPPIRSAPVSGSKSEKAKQDVERGMMAIAELETIRFNLVDEQLRVVDLINDLKDEIRIADGQKQKVDLELIDLDTIPQAGEVEEKKGTSSGGYKDGTSADFVRGGGASRASGGSVGSGDGGAPGSIGGPQENKVMSMTTGRVWEVERH